MVRKLMIAAVLLWPLVLQGGELGELADRIDRPTLGARVDVGGSLEIGRAAIEPGEGATIRALMAGDERCGVAVAGPATFRLLIDDPFSAPVAVRNLDRTSKLEVRKKDKQPRGGFFDLVGRGLVVGSPWAVGCRWRCFHA